MDLAGIYVLVLTVRLERLQIPALYNRRRSTVTIRLTLKGDTYDRIRRIKSVQDNRHEDQHEELKVSMTSDRIDMYTANVPAPLHYKEHTVQLLYPLCS